MTFDIIYLIVPFLLYSLQFVILTKYSRTDGSMQVAFYRQLTMFLAGLPILFFIPLDFQLLKDNLPFIFLTSLIGAIYLFINFKSLDYLPAAIGNVFQASTRVIFTIIIGILLLSESINSYQYIGVLLLVIGIFLLLKKSKFNYKGIILSIITGILLVANWYYFIKYSVNFNPIIAGYILEVFNGIILFFMLIFMAFKKKITVKKSFIIKKRNFLIILLTSPLPLLGTIAIAKSYEIFSFTIVGISLTMMIPATMLFGYLILKEKLSLRAIISILIITLSIIFIKFFE